MKYTLVFTFVFLTSSIVRAQNCSDKFSFNLSKSWIGIITDIQGKSLAISYERSIFRSIYGYVSLGMGVGQNLFKAKTQQYGLKNTYVYYNLSDYVDPGWLQQRIEVERGSVIFTPSLSHYSEFYQDIGLTWNKGFSSFNFELSAGLTSLFMSAHFSIEGATGEISLGLSEPVRIYHATPTYVSYWDWGNTLSIGLKYVASDRISIGPEITWRGYYGSVHNFYAGLETSIHW